MTGNQVIAAYTELVKNDLFPVLGITDSGVDATIALHYVNLGAERVMRSLRREAKDTFPFVSGTQSYDIQTDTSTRFFEVSRVTVAGADIERTTINDADGYYITGDTITFNSTAYQTGNTVVIYGYYYAPEIVATDSEITVIPKSLHLAIAQLSVVEACGSHETSGEQQNKLMNIQRLAEDAVTRQSQRDGMNTFPTALTNGKK